jgi:hypothetical protein
MDEWEAAISAPSNYLCLQRDVENVAGNMKDFVIDNTTPCELWDRPQDSTGTSVLPWKLIVRYGDMVSAEAASAACVEAGVSGCYLPWPEQVIPMLCSKGWQQPAVHRHVRSVKIEKRYAKTHRGDRMLASRPSPSRLLRGIWITS